MEPWSILYASYSYISVEIIAWSQPLSQLAWLWAMTVSMWVYEWKLSKVVYVKSSNGRGANFDGREKEEKTIKGLIWPNLLHGCSKFQPLSLCWVPCTTQTCLLWQAGNTPSPSLTPNCPSYNHVPQWFMSTVTGEKAFLHDLARLRFN